MSLTRFPDGLSSFGIPVVPFNLSVPQSAGKVLFVDDVYGNNGNDGASASSAVKTIGRAVSMANAFGCTIIIFPGSYDENVVVNKDYISLAGAFAGRYGWPDVEPATGITLNVTAQGFTCRNIRFAGQDATHDVVKQQGNGFLYQSCVFDGDGNGAATALVRLVGDDTDDSFTASEGRITGCLFRGSGGLGLIFDTAAPPTGVGSTDNDIDNNVFVGNTGIDIATKDTGAGTYSVQKTNIGPSNRFETKNKAVYIDLTTANGGAAGDQTGAITGNWFAADAITAGNEVKMVGTGFVFNGNYTTVGIKDGSGLD